MTGFWLPARSFCFCAGTSLTERLGRSAQGWCRAAETGRLSEEACAGEAGLWGRSREVKGRPGSEGGAETRSELVRFQRVPELPEVAMLQRNSSWGKSCSRNFLSYLLRSRAWETLSGIQQLFTEHCFSSWKAQ